MIDRKQLIILNQRDEYNHHWQFPYHEYYVDVYSKENLSKWNSSILQVQKGALIMIPIDDWKFDENIGKLF